MKQILAMLIAILGCFGSSAQYFAEGVLSYQITDKEANTVEVDAWLFKKAEKYTEDLTVVRVPETVMHEGKVYTVTSINNGVFSNDNELREVCLPNSVTDLGSNNFTECPALEKIVLSENIAKINISSFCKLPSLKSLELPEGLQSISFAITSCGFRELRLPKSVKSIYWAITNCDNLEHLELNTIAGFESPLFNSPIKSITFSENACLKDGVLPAFKELETVRFSKGCTAEGNSMEGSNNLRTVICEDDAITYGPCPFEWAVGALGKELTVWVPEEYAESFEKSDSWSAFTIRTGKPEVSKNTDSVEEIAFDEDGAVVVWTIAGMPCGRFENAAAAKAALAPGIYIKSQNGKTEKFAVK